MVQSSTHLTLAKELDDHAVHLLFSANRWELEQEIRNKLQRGTNVTIDRYANSGVAFSASKPSLSLDWCKQPDIGLPKPNLTCFLDVSEEVAMKRADFGSERYELTDMQRRVRENYARLRDPTWVTVSSDGTIEEVETEVFNIVIKELTKSDKGRIEKLWLDSAEEEHLVAKTVIFLICLKSQAIK